MGASAKGGLQAKNLSSEPHCTTETKSRPQPPAPSICADQEPNLLNQLAEQKTVLRNS
jgi:hypothetical protein